MKQSCRTFLFITSFVLGAKAEKGFKFVERSLENYWRKELKKRRLAVLGQPASLSAHPAPRPGLPSALPRADAPASLHPVAIRRRRGRAARPTPVGTRRLIPVGTPPRDPDAPFCPPSTPSPSPLASAAAAATAVAPLSAELRRSPQAALVARSLRQDHRRVRHRRGKPLRALPR